MSVGLEFGEAAVEVKICSLPACIPGQSGMCVARESGNSS